VIKHHVRRNRDGEPVWTIRITGVHDIFRFAFHSVQGQVEFGRMASQTFRYLRRFMGHAQFVAYDERMTGGRIEKWGYGKGSGRDE